MSRKKQQSPYYIFGFFSILITLSLFSYFTQKTEPFFAYLLAINLSTFLLYGYDKMISSGYKLRVPEWTLHVPAMGGSPAGLFVQKLFRHRLFQLIYWLILFIQVTVILWLELLILTDTLNF